MGQLWQWLKDQNFIKLVKVFENFTAKVLSLGMVGVIIVGIIDLSAFLVRALLTRPLGSIGVGLLEIFGLFLNILIAFEILAYGGVGVAKPRTVPVGSDTPTWCMMGAVAQNGFCWKVQLRGGTSRVCSWRVLAVAPR